MFYVAYRTFTGYVLSSWFFFFFFFLWTLWNVYIFSNMAGENACALKSREKDYFSKQNITSNVLQTKKFWYQFCNFKHFLKAENSEDSLATSCAEKPN